MWTIISSSLFLTKFGRHRWSNNVCLFYNVLLVIRLNPKRSRSKTWFSFVCFKKLIQEQILVLKSITPSNPFRSFPNQALIFLRSNCSVFNFNGIEGFFYAQLCKYDLERYFQFCFSHKLQILNFFCNLYLLATTFFFKSLKIMQVLC